MHGLLDRDKVLWCIVFVAVEKPEERDHGITVLMALLNTMPQKSAAHSAGSPVLLTSEDDAMLKVCYIAAPLFSLGLSYFCCVY